ncbi:MAG: hypothetical protein Q7K42_04375 [Candidatus Diapherotrites archaeon]|nr:hypothetical protein [Candidatus Diapherotrites archaeon]
MEKFNISLQEIYGKKLRNLAMTVFEGKKGGISKTIENALDEYEKKIRREKAWDRLMTKASNSKDLGIGKFTREEANE